MCRRIGEYISLELFYSELELLHPKNNNASFYSLSSLNCRHRIKTPERLFLIGHYKVSKQLSVLRPANLDTTKYGYVCVRFVVYHVHDNEVFSQDKCSFEPFVF